MYGTSSDSLKSTVYYNDAGLTAPSGSYSVSVASLQPSTTYYYRAVIQFGDNDYQGEILSFTTPAQQDQVSYGLLELPAAKTLSNTFSETLTVGGERNYSYLYDKSMYASLWAAYPLTAAHLEGDAKTSTWSYNPHVPQSAQINMEKSYGSFYGDDSYNRGHIVPNADRKHDQTMNSQLYYCTNQSPQIGPSFNGSVWSTLESSVRSLTSTYDTVYVVTGAAFHDASGKGNETITYLNANSTSYPQASPSRLPVPNYFWKAVLTVERSANGTITKAKAIGFWFENKSYTSGTAFTSCQYSIDELEKKTGFDLFANLPDSIEAAAESIESWSDFLSSK